MMKIIEWLHERRMRKEFEKFCKENGHEDTDKNFELFQLLEELGAKEVRRLLESVARRGVQ